MCPITSLANNGLNKFIGLWTCGHVFSVKATKEINKERKCLVCEREYNEEDRIDLNMTTE